MKSEDSRIIVDEFFQTVAECYTLSAYNKKPVKNGSDGDFRVSL